MAEKRLSAQGFASAGVAPSYYTSATAVALTVGDFAPSGDQFLLNPGEWLLVKTGATPVNIIIQTPGTVDGLAIADRTIAVPANVERLIGPFDAGAYGNPVKFALSAITNLSIAVFR